MQSALPMILAMTLAAGELQAQNAAPAVPVASPAPLPDAVTTVPQQTTSPRWRLPLAPGATLLTTVARDQKTIWASPRRLKTGDADWLLPLGAITAGLLASDHRVTSGFSPSPTVRRRSRNISRYGVAALAGAAGGLYLWGELTQQEHRRETGMLAAEALLSTAAVTEAIKLTAGRSRPALTNGADGFFGNDSFPSRHAAWAWSLAGVIAHEYPGPLTRLAAYGAATAVSVSRVAGKQHFPSDVLIGGTVGWLVARHVYRARHDAALGGGTWDWPIPLRDVGAAKHDGSLASTFVPIESWVYPAFEMLSALGYVRTSISGMQPWTRSECARLVEQAEENLGAETVGSEVEVRQTVTLLTEEFARELGGASDNNRTAQVESTYTRVLTTSGPALTDGFHFGQTVAYDFGRPYRRGTNAIIGATLSATHGKYLGFARVEYQCAPGAPGLSDSLRSLKAKIDKRLPQPFRPVSALARARLVEGYAGINVRGWEVLAGKQSLDWGVGRDGSLLLSNNAEPISMVRITRASPIILPALLRHLGSARTEFFIGRLGGHDFIRSPLIYGQKLTVRPYPFLELGYGRTTMLGGTMSPEARTLGVVPSAFTIGNFLHSFFGASGAPPGNSQNAFDIVLRVPGLANGVLLYTELYQDDDLIFFYRPGRGVYRPGILVSRLPGLSRMDFRAEVTSSESPSNFNHVGALNYWHIQYRDGQTHNGLLLGNVVGRQGKNVQAWLGYRLSPRNRVEFSFKWNLVDAAFVPGGGRWQDYTLRHEARFSSGLYVKSFVQFEHIASFPALFPGRVNNVTASVELGFALREGWQQRPQEK